MQLVGRRNAVHHDRGFYFWSIEPTLLRDLSQDAQHLHAKGNIASSIEVVVPSVNSGETYPADSSFLIAIIPSLCQWPLQPYP